MTAARTADLTLEAELTARGFPGVVGIDEVGRGALAGPVTVGAAWVPRDAVLQVAGLTDSKALTPERRRSMVPEILAWVNVGTGSAEPEEIDALGMTLALRLAGLRALDRLAERVGVDVLVSSAVLLDGTHDWLTRPDDLLSLAEPDPLAVYREGAVSWELPVTTQVKGDFRCASIASASVVAKVERDALMERLASSHPAFGWDGNKGYGSSAHREALRRLGPTPLHRLSWNLGTTSAQDDAARLLRAQGSSTAR